MLRITKFLNRSTTEVQVAFSETLNSDIGVSNIAILSNIPSIPPLEIRSVEVSKNVLTITTSLQRPAVLYYLRVLSTDTQIFSSIDGSIIQDDGNTNQVFFLGLESGNEIRDTMLADAPPVYDLDDNTFVRKFWSSMADKIFRARVDIRESGNSNYIKETVTNEIKRRGFGALDRLLQESAYQVLRVAKTPEGSTIAGVLTFSLSNATSILGPNYLKSNPGISQMPSYPVSLRSVRVSETVSNEERINNKFEGLLVTLSKKNVAVINSVTLNRGTGGSVIYDIPKYGYSALSNYYDLDFARPLLTLTNSQFKLADAAVIDGDFYEPTGQDEIVVNYTYIDNGIDTVENSLVISEVLQSVREPVGGFLTIFSLKNYPIVNGNGGDISSGGVKFLDPSATMGAPFISIHPAFKTEIPFSSARLPGVVGEYSVNYQSGQVFVYGQSINAGTGSQPPVATYYYKKIYADTIDFNYNSDTDDISTIPGRDIIGRQVSVKYSYDKILDPDTDYRAEVHVETVNESVENRLISSFSIATKNAPITEVFEVFNETTGETYAISRFDDNFVYFSGRQLPRIESVSNEQVEFKTVVGEPLYVSENIAEALTYKIVEAKIQNGNLASAFSKTGASNVNTSVTFGRSDLFIKEFYYDNVLQTVAQNILKLRVIGDYLIDYQNGLVYLRTGLEQSFDLGDISYDSAIISPIKSNIIGVNQISYKRSAKDIPLVDVQYQSFTPTSIFLKSLPESPERFYKGNTKSPILLGTVQFGTIGQYSLNSTTFTALDANFTASHADGYHALKIANDSDRSILSVISATQIVVDTPFAANKTGVAWTLLDGNPQFPSGDGYRAVTTYDIVSVRGVYLIGDLQSLDSGSLTNYYDQTLDVISGNTILFKNPLISSLAPGTALAIDYSFGRLYAGYDYVKDSLLVTYEHGDNSLSFDIGNALDPEEEYFVTYRYGALREELIQNFGTLTQMQELAGVPLEMDRELYRDFLSAALEGGILGSTLSSLKNSVEIVTKIEPEIRELTFNEWTSSRDNLFLQEPLIHGTPKYEIGKYDNGLYIGEDFSLKLPSEAYLSFREGSFECWVRPDWNGIDNDASLTFDISQDGYSPIESEFGLLDGYRLNLSDIYIGSTGFHPSEVPFAISRFDDPASPVGRPAGFGLSPGVFIWYDDAANNWAIAGIADPASGISLEGLITTSGDIYNVEDGYTNSILTMEATDTIRSTSKYIEFAMVFDGYEVSGPDGYDGYAGFEYLGSDGYAVNDGYLFHDEIRFSSDNHHYLIDTGPSEYHNRLSIFKDGFGYLNFRVYDDAGSRSLGRAKMYNLAHNIMDWRNGGDYFVGASWRLNSAEGIDEMHLFVDGIEVSNLFKYGGRPEASTGTVFRTVADEVLISSSPKTVIGGSDGESVASSAQFVAEGFGLISAGIVPGDLLWILDSTADGASSPHTILSVPSSDSIVLTAPLTLSLANVNFSINRTTYNVGTNVDVEKFSLFTFDGYDSRVELRGLDATSPDYEISRDAGVNNVHINNGVRAGLGIVVNTLGLTKARCRDLVYEYVFDGHDGYVLGSTTNQIETRSAPPASLAHVDIYKVPFPRASIDERFSSTTLDGYFAIIANNADGYFHNVCQPSNSVNGKVLSVTLGGQGNINFSGTNEVVFHGTTYGGPTVETVSFTQYGTLTTINFFTTITYIDMFFTGYDGYRSLGAVEISEKIPMTKSENGGDYAQVGFYDNGVFSLFVYGSGGVAFDLEPCHYRMDYPVSLNIPMSKKGPLFIGSDINEENQWKGVVEQPIFLNDMLDDIRLGEDKATQRTMTQDFNSPAKLGVTPQTLMLLNLNNKIENIDKYYANFDDRFLTTSTSVNSSFKDAGVFLKKPYVIDNGSVVFNNNQGSIEFWVSPIIDTYYDDENTRFYIDITSIENEELISTTSTVVQLARRARRIISVRLYSDSGTGVNYFEDGKLMVDGSTIILGQSLPGQSTVVKVQYVPIDFNGDRVSIFKDGYGSVNFAMIAGDNIFKISYPISWRRNTWHRIMATWKTNSTDNKDRIRMFIDGIERGTITYGTPSLLYGSGMVYGSAAVGTIEAGFLTADINLTDTFGEVVVGSSFDRLVSGSCRIDNLRFSSIAREPAIIGDAAVDLNYNSNLEAVSPVIDDNLTTGIFDFDMVLSETEFLSTLLSKYTSQYQLDVIVDDSFRRIVDDPTNKELLVKIIKRLKPAHTNLFVKFLQDT